MEFSPEPVVDPTPTFVSTSDGGIYQPIQDDSAVITATTTDLGVTELTQRPSAAEPADLSGELPESESIEGKVDSVLLEDSVQNPGIAGVGAPYIVNLDGSFGSHISNALSGTIKLGLAFMLLYFGVFIAYLYIAPRHQLVGFVALAVFNLTFVIGSLLGGSFIYGIHMGLRVGMALSSLFASGFIFSTIYIEHPWLLLVGSAFGGFFLGILWLSQSIYLSRSTSGHNSTKGRLTGVFLFLYSLSTLLGSIGAIVSMDIGMIDTTMLWLLAFVSLVAIVFFASLPLMKNTTISEGHVKITVSQNILSLINLAKSPRARVFLPLFIAQGVAFVFSTGSMPVTVTQYSPQIYPAVLVAYGLGLALSTPLMGWILDLKGHNWLFRLEMIFQVAMIAFINGGSALTDVVGMNVMFVFLGFFSGVSDSTLSCLSNTMLLITFHDDSEVALAFSLYRVVYGVACTLGYLLAGSIMPLLIEILMIICLMIAMIINNN